MKKYSAFILVVLLLLAYQTFGWLGFIVVFGIEIIFSFIVIYTYRDTIKMMYYNLETKLFGKPLQKELWTKDEWNEYKKNVKIVLWKKKDKKVI